MRSCDEKPHGYILAELIASYLLSNERVIGLVIIEGIHDVVAVGPRVFAELIAFVAGGFSPADNVEPVLSPSFAELR